MDKDFLIFFRQLQKDRNFIFYRDKVIQQEFDKIKEEIINEFNNHPITREIEMGPTAPNISGTLGGIGNLYSFIGFEVGTDPISPIRELLRKSSYNINNNNLNPTSRVKFEIPTAKMIFSMTPMPWAIGRSWAKGIETGISGLGYYLYLKKQAHVNKSRSTMAIQQKEDTVRTGVRFKNTKYISNLINEFEKKIKKLDRMTI